MAAHAPVLLELPRPVAEPRRGPRAAVARALSRCATRERVLLALILFEHLTPAEAASVLDVPVARIERAYAALLAELRDLLARRVSRVRPRTAAPRGGAAREPRPAVPARLRRAS